MRFSLAQSPRHTSVEIDLGFILGVISSRVKGVRILITASSTGTCREKSKLDTRDARPREDALLQAERLYYRLRIEYLEEDLTSEAARNGILSGMLERCYIAVSEI